MRNFDKTPTSHIKSAQKARQAPLCRLSALRTRVLWGSGARLWSVNNRTRYANDLGFAASLVAVTDNVNQSKGDKDPAEWLPSRTAARCTYAIQWVQVKYRWRLSINPAERSRLSSILSGSCGSRTTPLPARAI